MRSPLSDDTDSLPYSFANGVRKACMEALKKQQGLIATRKRSANSSGGRARRNVVRAVPPVELLAEVLRRHKRDSRRAYMREYMRDWRQKKAVR